MSNRLKIFLIIDVVISVIIAIVGIFFFPLLGWIIGNCFPVWILLVVLCGISGVILLIWFISVMVFYISKYTHWIKWMGCPKITLLVLGLSMGITFGICLKRVDPLYSCKRWGNCLVSKWGHGFYSMFGTKKPVLWNCLNDEKSELAAVYTQDHKPHLLHLHTSDQKGKKDSECFYYKGNKLHCTPHIVEYYAIEYDENGDFFKKYDTRTYYYEETNKSDFDTYGWIDKQWRYKGDFVSCPQCIFDEDYLKMLDLIIADPLGSNKHFIVHYY